MESFKDVRHRDAKIVSNIHRRKKILGAYSKAMDRPICRRNKPDDLILDW